MPAPYRIEMLGGLRVRFGERVVTRFRTQKTASLLAYLAYHPSVQHPREVLIEAIWPGRLPEAGRMSLSTALWALRRQLEPPGVPHGTLIQADRFSVGLNPSAFSTDVHDVLAAIRDARRAPTPRERQGFLDQALSPWNAELLPGHYEDWIIEEQRRLSDLREAAEHERDRLLAELGHAPATSMQSVPAPSPPPPSAHLPLRLTRFFGRQAEIAWLEERLRSGARLITLVGFAGAGKTRLAVEVAERVAGPFHGRVWFVPLAALSDPQSIPDAVVDAIGIPRAPAQDPMEQAARALGGAPSLLVLDNFEQVAEGGAGAVRELLARVPELSVLVTSRRLLKLTGEQEFAVPPLPVPECEEAPERLTRLASVQLFVDRAQAARPDFQVTARNAEAVAQLSRRLEGVPLAIELAAARAQVLSPAQILEQLDSRFDFLVARKRDAVDRHRSLHAAVAWSCELLSPELQRFFRRLSVFRGGWTLEAARDVCDEPQALEYLERLRDASLILIDETEFGTRFRLLETLREFGWHELSELERACALRRHADFCIRLAEEGDQRLTGPDAPEWLRRLDADHGNLRAALGWCLGSAPGCACRLGAAMCRFWEGRGLFHEGKEQLHAIFEAVESLDCRYCARALAGGGWLCFMAGDFPSALEWLRRGIRYGRALADARSLAVSLGSLGAVLSYQADYPGAESALQESLRLCEAAGDSYGAAFALLYLGVVANCQVDYRRADAYYGRSLTAARASGSLAQIANALHYLGNCALSAGDPVRAKPYCDRSVEPARRVGDQFSLAACLWGVASVERELGNHAAARKALAECVQIVRESRLVWGAAFAIEALGYQAAAEGRHRQAARALGTAEALRQQLGVPMPLAHHRMHFRHLDLVVEGLDRAVLRAEWGTGRLTAWEDALASPLTPEA